MSVKNIIGVILCLFTFTAFVTNVALDGFKDFGWNTLWVTPLTVLLTVGFWILVDWLLDL